MSTYTVLMLFITNVVMLFVGFLVGDEYHHEAAEVADEAGWDRHVQQALWVARRSL